MRTLSRRLGEAGEIEALMKRMAALSIRQPRAEQILRGKKIEYPNMPTNKTRACLCFGEHDDGGPGGVG
jgi:hypothetical protein